MILKVRGRYSSVNVAFEVIIGRNGGVATKLFNSQNYTPYTRECKISTACLLARADPLQYYHQVDKKKNKKKKQIDRVNT